jgi:hypothetical protein
MQELAQQGVVVAPTIIVTVIETRNAFITFLLTAAGYH